MGCRGDIPYCDIMSMHPGVTGSCNLGVAKLPDGRTKKFLVDFGLFQEKKYRELNDIIRFKAKEIEFCIVTHNHLDHIGRIPFLIRKGFRGKIYTTPATKKLAKISLKDNLKVHIDDSKKKKTPILYGSKDVEMAQTLMYTCEYNETFWADENIKITFLENGHMVGAATVLIQICYPGYKEINLFFTGDYNYENVFFDVKKIPDWRVNFPLIIQESTYGTTDSCNIVENFEPNVVSCINNGGTVILAAYAQERTQRVLYELKCIQQSGKLDPRISIYSDGNLAKEYTQAYLHKELGIKAEMRNFLPRNFNYVDKIYRRHLLKNKNPKIILATSGMGTFGPIQDYIKTYITDSKALIQATGFAVEGSLMYNLINSEYGELIKIGGVYRPKIARVESSNQFSAHIKADEIEKFLNTFPNKMGVLLNHGDLNVMKSLQARISKDGTKVGILGNGHFYRVYSDSFEEYESKW